MQWEEKLFWISRGFRTTITIEIACPAAWPLQGRANSRAGVLRVPCLCVSMPRHNHLRRRDATGSIESELGVGQPALGALGK
jgi:hypothetical protein